jgi:hypothetical protein
MEMLPQEVLAKCMKSRATMDREQPMQIVIKRLRTLFVKGNLEKRWKEWLTLCENTLLQKLEACIAEDEAPFRLWQLEIVPVSKTWRQSYCWLKAQKPPSVRSFSDDLILTRYKYDDNVVYYALKGKLGECLFVYVRQAKAIKIVLNLVFVAFPGMLKPEYRSYDLFGHILRRYRKTKAFACKGRLYVSEKFGLHVEKTINSILRMLNDPVKAVVIIRSCLVLARADLSLARATWRQMHGEYIEERIALISLNVD